MKIQKLKALVFTIITLLAFSSYTFSQKARTHGERGGKNLAAMKEELNLTGEQEREIEAINEKFKARFQELRQGESENKWAELKVLKKEHHAAAAAVLTPEQTEKLKDIKIVKQNRKKEIRKDTKKDFKANMMPLLKTQRKKLDAEISVQDKKEIDRLRKVAKEIKKESKKEKEAFRKEKQEHKGKRLGGSGHHFHGKHKVLNKMKTEQPANFKSLSALTEKYERQINALHEEIAPQLEQWKNEKRQMREKRVEEMDIPEEKKAEVREKMKRKKEMRQKRQADKKEDGFKTMFFLLLDPDKVDADGQEARRRAAQKNKAAQQINAYPNPGYDVQTLEFEIKKSGEVTIEILDKSGKLAQAVFNDFMEAGKHSLKVDVSKLGGGIYYYNVTDETGKASMQFMIAK